MSEKRRYNRLAPLSWNLNRGRSLWIQGVKIKDMAIQLGTSEKNLKRAARRYGWPSRKRHRQDKLNWVPLTVTRRCPDCLGQFQTLAGNYSPHPDCPAARQVA